MKYAHRSAECNDLRFQFPKFRLVRCFTLSTQIYLQSAKWKSYWLIETNIRKTLQVSAFSFIVLNLAEKAILHFPFNYAGLCKERRVVGVGREGEISPALSRKLERSSLIFRKNPQIVVIYWLNFSFKMHLLSFSRRRTPNVSPAGPVLLVL